MTVGQLIKIFNLQVTRMSKVGFHSEQLYKQNTSARETEKYSN